MMPSSCAVERGDPDQRDLGWEDLDCDIAVQFGVGGPHRLWS